jgi:hypothetical protein
MMHNILKWTAISMGCVLVLVGAFFCFIRMTSDGDRIRSVQKVVSPDGKMFAEVQEIITPTMGGGADTERVIIRPVNKGSGITVYRQVFECGADVNSFSVHWTGAKELTVIYSAWYSDNHGVNENRLLMRNERYRDVQIKYKYSGRTYHAGGTADCTLLPS